MRGAVLAACVAVLTGLAPAGALGCASFASTAAAAQADTVSAVQRASASARRDVRPPSARRPAREMARSAPPREAPHVFRDPSGPAPSRAPPAAA